MRIVQWAFPYLPTMGGREIFIQRISRSLLERGHDVQVIAPPAGVAEFIAPEVVEPDEFPVLRHNVRMILLSKNEQLITQAREDLLHDLARINPEIIHLHNNGPEVVILRDALRSANLKPKLVYTHHGLSEDTTFWRYTLSMVSMIVAVSQYSGDELKISNPEISHKLITINNGVPIPIKTSPIDSRLTSIFAFGRLSEEKGFNILLDAWSMLRPTPEGLALTIAGDGLAAGELKAQVKSLGLEGVVEFTGWESQDQVRKRIEAARLVVIPSIWNEPFGLAAAEAQAQARPVIASDVGGLREIVQDQSTGILVSPEDPRKLSAALNSVVHDIHALQSMGQHGHSRMRNLFNWEKCVSQYEDLYSELMFTDA